MCTVDHYNVKIVTIPFPSPLLPVQNPILLQHSPSALKAMRRKTKKEEMFVMTLELLLLFK